MKARIKSGYALLKQKPWVMMEEEAGVRLTLWQKLVLVLPALK